MIRSWCPPRKVVAEQVQRPDIYAVYIPLEVPFKAQSEHFRFSMRGCTIRESRRENATGSVGGKRHGQRGPLVASIWQWAASAGGALGCQALGDRDEVGQDGKGGEEDFRKLRMSFPGTAKGICWEKVASWDIHFVRWAEHLSRHFVPPHDGPHLLLTIS